MPPEPSLSPPTGVVTPEPAPSPGTTPAVASEPVVPEPEPASGPLGLGLPVAVDGGGPVRADGGHGAVAIAIAVGGGSVGGDGCVGHWVKRRKGAIVNGGDVVVVVFDGREITSGFTTVVHIDREVTIAIAIEASISVSVEASIAVEATVAIAIEATIAIAIATSSNVGLLLCPDLVVAAIESLSRGAVKVEPPVADEVLLVEYGAVGAQERVLGQATFTIGRADVEHLALSGRISIVTC